MKRVLGRRELAPRALVRVDHAHPMTPANVDAFGAALRWVNSHFGIDLAIGADMMAGRLLGTYIRFSLGTSERAQRLARIGAVYPEAAAEAWRAGR